MRVTEVQQVAEMICGNLYKTNFQFLGETDNGASTWWTRGVAPKIVRVEVQRSTLAPVVLINLEFPNISVPGQVFRARKTLQVHCADGGVFYNDTQLMEASAHTIKRILETFRDVLEGKGAAGPDGLKDKIAHDTQYDTDHSD